MKVDRFWMVYRLGHGAPTAVHSTHTEAMIEAARLAQQHISKTFVVLEAKEACAIEGPVTWVDCD